MPQARDLLVVLIGSIFGLTEILWGAELGSPIGTPMIRQLPAVVLQLAGAKLIFA